MIILYYGIIHLECATEHMYVYVLYENYHFSSRNASVASVVSSLNSWPEYMCPEYLLVDGPGRRRFKGGHTRC